MEGYCVKCRAKKEIKDAQAITMKNGKLATQGVCPTCSTTTLDLYSHVAPGLQEAAARHFDEAFNQVYNMKVDEVATGNKAE